MNEHIEPFSYAEALMKALPKGVLLSTEKKGAHEHDGHRLGAPWAPTGESPSSRSMYGKAA